LRKNYVYSNNLLNRTALWWW